LKTRRKKINSAISSSLQQQLRKTTFTIIVVIRKLNSPSCRGSSAGEEVPVVGKEEQDEENAPQQ